MEIAGTPQKQIGLLPMTRVDFARWLAERGINTGAEIGVAVAEYSVVLCEAMEGPIYLIDPWKEYPREVYCDTANVSQLEHDMRFRYVNNFIKVKGLNAKVMRMTSMEAAEEFEPASLDFVYIDANHAYEWVVIDLEAWWPKVRSGGFVCGHDFSTDSVYNAVADHVTTKNDWRRLLIITEYRDICLAETGKNQIEIMENKTEDYVKKFSQTPGKPLSYAIEKT